MVSGAGRWEHEDKIIKKIMEDFPILHTERLILNQPQEADIDDLILLLNQTTEFFENTLTFPYPYKKENAEFWIKMSENGFENKDAFVFAIRDKKNFKIIGGIGLHGILIHQKAEIGYWIAKDFWAKGIATEALKAVIDFGFNDLNLNKLYATHYPHNPASGKVMQKCGMVYEARLNQEYCKNGNFLDVIRYCILRGSK